MVRRMRELAVTVFVVFGITLLAAPTMGAGWYWDVGNAIGFAAFAGLLYLTITSTQRLDVRAHQVLAYGVLVLSIGHAFWFLLGDGAAVDFLKPGAPDYMWLGLVSLILLAVLMTIAVVPDRFRAHKNYTSFKYWHQVLAVATIATATYHIVVSQFYLATWFQAGLFVAAAIAAAFGRKYWMRLGQLKIASNKSYLLVSTIVGAVFVIVRNVSP